MKRIAIVALAGAACASCGDPAQFQPAKGAKDLPSVNEAIRVAEAKPACETIGLVVEAKTIDAIAATAANHGGTHFRVTSDFGGKVVGTETVTGQTFGEVHNRATVREVKEHHFVAEVYRCL